MLIVTVPTLGLLLAKLGDPLSKAVEPPPFVIALKSKSAIVNVPEIELPPPPTLESEKLPTLAATPLTVKFGLKVPFDPVVRIYVCVPSARTFVLSSVSTAKLCDPGDVDQESAHPPPVLQLETTADALAAPSMNKIARLVEIEMYDGLRPALVAPFACNATAKVPLAIPACAPDCDGVPLEPAPEQAVSTAAAKMSEMDARGFIIFPYGASAQPPRGR